MKEFSLLELGFFDERSGITTSGSITVLIPTPGRI